MDRRTVLTGLGAAGVMGSMMTGLKLEAQMEGGSMGPVYELRIYHVAEGKLEALLARFRDHTMTIFTRHGMKSLAYWTPTDEPLKGRTLVYMLEHPTRTKATENWQAFHNDPEWKKVSAESEANGKLVEKVDSTFLVRTPFSPKI